MTITPGDKLRLKTEIARMYDKALKVYGKKNEQVTVISVHGEVLIVEGKTERYSVKTEDVKAS